MDSIVHDEFYERQDDLELIIDLIQSLKDGSKIQVTKSDGTTSTLNYDDKLTNTLCSALFLLTYNQIESTMRGCLESLYDHFSDENVSYRTLKADIQKEILNGIVKNYENGEKLHDSVGSELELKSPSISLNIRKVFNGNIDTSKVLDIKKTYGINITQNPAHRNGCDISAFKTARNDLAHGNKSFSKLGAENSLPEVINMSERVALYLDTLIDAFNEYINNKDYYSSSISAVPEY